MTPVSIFGIAGFALIGIVGVLIAFEWRDRHHRAPSGGVREAGWEARVATQVLGRGMA